MDTSKITEKATIEAAEIRAALVAVLAADAARHEVTDVCLYPLSTLADRLTRQYVKEQLDEHALWTLCELARVLERHDYPSSAVRIGDKTVGLGGYLTDDERTTLELLIAS